ncbi:MAG: DNA polymerase III subunit gamma/tau [Thermoguttaceae bacterium]|nr:DNA polymerase III subunit gamma/tau [Thermoguttaceae bacterium]MDW8037958.1 DNA polymerase III subunit gamma/tau [Thermoguttaceae bacterium]
MVARRYRPQRFEELVGQEHVTKALVNAISSNRVGHAYLFTGARGVGKTSTARIFAKALNCQQGISPTPCNRCEICRAISTGEDVDVLEIDGASNRGIEEIRTLRQNVGVRPSRARFKIYIIDEVHMLTKEAFNALLKTLEEPPEHVKFIFCTTEPNKIPITILSRCQRFDFAGIGTEAILRRLQQIVESEKVSVDPEALEAIARRAAGSMRDAESLLEQLLAFSSGNIRLEDVHELLGTAGDERMVALVDRLLQQDAAGALMELDAAVQQGVDVALLVEQMLGYFRDCMAAALGCPANMFLYTPSRLADQVAETGRRLGLQRLLAIEQLLDHTLNRMRFSTQGRLLAELALVRICQLEDLERLAELIAAVRSEGGRISIAEMLSKKLPSAEIQDLKSPEARQATYGNQETLETGQEAKKKEVQLRPQVSPSPPEFQQTGVGPETAKGFWGQKLSPTNATEVWQTVLRRVGGLLGEHGRYFRSVTAPSETRLVVQFDPAYTVSKAFCERPEQLSRLERALEELLGYRVQVVFQLADSSGAPTDRPPPFPERSYQERLAEVQRRTFVQRAIDLFGAQPIQLILPQPPEEEPNTE